MNADKCKAETTTVGAALRGRPFFARARTGRGGHGGPPLQSILPKRVYVVVSWVIAVLLIQAQIAFAQTRNITVEVDKPGAAVPKTLFGLFFEDINFGADGGLYPERVKNRSFEFSNPMMGWKQLDRGDGKGQLYVFDHGSVNDTPNSHYLRIKSSGN